MEVVLVDDVDGSPAAVETVTFSLDGTGYEIDLNDENATRLRSSLEDFVRGGRKLGGSRSSGPRTSSRSTDSLGGAASDNAKIRDWAKAHGHTVSERGRIKADVVAAYNAANG